MDMAAVLRRLPSRTINITPIRRWPRPRKTCRPTRKAMVEKPAGCNLVTGRVTKILKRGEELPEPLLKHKKLTKEEKNESLKHKKLVKKEKNDMADSKRFFGGLSFYSFDSPAPSSLPVPSFLTKKIKSVTSLCMDEEALDLELLEFGFLDV